jgi:hypothetical protein
VVNVADPVEFVDGRDSSYYEATTNPNGKYNYNMAGALAFNHGALHWVYESNGGGSHVTPHNPYARFDLSSQTVDRRRSPEFGSDDGGTLGHNFGNFVQDTTQAGRLFDVGQGTGSQGFLGILLVLRSDDGGGSWVQYALGPLAPGVGPNGLLYVSAYRWVLSDGAIVGTFSLADPPNTVFVFRVAPQ